MTAAWPSTISQNALQSGYTEQPQRNVVTFEPEAGIAMERRRSSVSTDAITFPAVLSSAEWAALLTFYRDTLKDGTLPFTRLHPRTNETETFKFTEAPAIAAVYGAHYRISISLIRMP